jgi:hypothetical protein
VAGVHGLRICLDDAHIHFGHNELQVHCAHRDWLTGSIADEHIDHARSYSRPIKLQCHAQIAELRNLRDGRGGQARVAIREQNEQPKAGRYHEAGPNATHKYGATAHGFTQRRAAQ